MDNQSIANIYLADQRGLSLSDQHRSWHTFNYGPYQNPHREALGALRVFNEDTLAGGKSITHRSENMADVLILPLVGAVDVLGAGQAHFVEAGQVLVLHLLAGESYRIENPYPDDLVSYLEIIIRKDSQPLVSHFYTFDLQKQSDTLFSVMNGQGRYRLSLGQFTGRTDVSHMLHQDMEDCFVFVIEGVFEVQNRLLQARDGLFLRSENHLEFEALSNGAILLLLEC